MARMFTMTLKMKNEEQAREVLPVLQAAMIGEYDIDENGNLTQESLECVKQILDTGKDKASVSIANLELKGNVIRMSCVPSFEDCEGGVCSDALQTVAGRFPNFTLEYESMYEDTIADMKYDENASLENGKFFYKYYERIDIEGAAFKISGTYMNGEWDFVGTNIFYGACPECGYMIECDEGEETECFGCGATFAYDELAEDMEMDDSWDDDDDYDEEDFDEEDFDEDDHEELD